MTREEVATTIENLGRLHFVSDHCSAARSDIALEFANQDALDTQCEGRSRTG
jgi:hypothetical protein